MIPTRPNGEPQNGQLTAARAEPTAAADPLGQTRSHSAQESLGLSANSGVVKASVQAGVGTAILLAGLTFGPYFWEKSQAGAKTTPAPAEKAGVPVAAQQPVAPAPATPDPSSAAKLPAGNPPVAGKQPSKGDIVDKLGENGTKTAPAKVNPLDKKDDDILKDIK